MTRKQLGDMILEEKNGSILFLDVLDLLPLAFQILLPQADLVVTTTDSKDIATEAPAGAPKDGIKFQRLAGPLAWIGCIRCPNANSLILRGRCNVRLGENAR